MKSFIKKVMVVVVVLATMVDWPVEIDAFNTRPIVKPIAKEGASLLRSCSKSTKLVEQEVNRATQTTEEVVNKAAASAAKNPYVLQRGVVQGGSRTIINSTRSNAKTTSQPRMLCSQCYGKGFIQGNDGYVYSCNSCKGTGKIIIK